MDLTEMFAPDSADFSCLAEEIPDDPLFVSKFVHKCCITMGEWGIDVVGTSGKHSALTFFFDVLLTFFFCFSS